MTLAFCICAKAECNSLNMIRKRTALTKVPTFA
jgi:hypothetical protein